MNRLSRVSENQLSGEAYCQYLEGGTELQAREKKESLSFCVSLSAEWI
jgi:hypothetical protein